MQKYGTPLPILLPCSPLHPAYVPSHPKSRPSILHSLVSGLTGRSREIYPQCVGTYDRATRSVIVERREDMDILFRRGFFGKGSLSRSEPTWRARRIDLLKGGECE
jgi:tRNA-splicing endonuclease subunit Sen2